MRSDAQTVVLSSWFRSVNEQQKIVPLECIQLELKATQLPAPSLFGEAFSLKL